MKERTQKFLSKKYKHVLLYNVLVKLKNSLFWMFSLNNSTFKSIRKAILIIIKN